MLDEFYTLSEEELYYKKLYESGRSKAEYIILPQEVEKQARLEERIVLSAHYYSKHIEDKVLILKHPCYMPRYHHSHRFVEMTYVLSGQVEEDIEGTKLTAREGDTVIILPGFYHSIWQDDERTVAINLLVDRDFFFSLDRRFTLNLASASFVIFEGVDLKAEIEDMLEEEKGKKDEVTLDMKQVILEKIFLSLKRKGEVRRKESEERKEVFRIVSYIEENSRTVTLATFAQDFGITEQYASRLIREKTGRSFSEITKKIRMEEAAALLRNARLSSKEISYMIGYSSPEHFSRTFKAYYGASPETWRKREH